MKLVNAETGERFTAELLKIDGETVKKGDDDGLQIGDAAMCFKPVGFIAQCFTDVGLPRALFG